jgi:translation initiation factor IF-2
MEEQKSQLVEKRLSKGVIRRRALADQPQAEAPAPETKAAAERPLKVVDKAATVAPTPVSKKTTVPVASRGLTLDEGERAHRAAIVEKNLKGKLSKVVEEKTPEVVAVPVSTPTEVVKPVVPTAAEIKAAEVKKEEQKKVLTFKDRIRGTISLDKIKAAREQAKQVQRVAAGVEKTGVDAPRTPSEESAEEKAKNEKVARTRKGVKVIGGDLDIDGLGRSTTLTQLVRTFPADRVYRPGASRKKKIISKKSIKSTTLTTRKASKRIIQVDQTIAVGDLAQQLGVKSGEIIKQLMNLGVMVTINQEIDKDTATLVANEYQYEVRDVSFKEATILSQTTEGTEEEAQGELRPPVVTVMGHVDHGKTSLLDAIRSTNVTEGEAGGITQHIGAYTVSLPQGQVTFLDTPGHEAFTTMRARGAKVTDIVILVVAADDGIMPQTEESIDHARAAGVPIIVAVNKIDKPEADAEKVKRQLAEKGLLPEEWGGETIYAQVSAKQKIGIPELLESVLLQAEVLELKASAGKRATGTVLEAKLDRFKGAVCTLLIQDGTLNVGDFIVAGTTVGKVKAMQDWKGKDTNDSGPSMAVEVLGLEGVPEAGDAFHAVETEQDARKIAEFRIDEKRKTNASQSNKVSLEDMFSRMKAGEMKELNIVLKTDVQGSLEAVRDSLLKQGNEDVKTKIIHAGVGGVSESDVTLAAASGAIIIGFNVRPETKAIYFAKEKGVEIKLYKIIYDLVNEVKLALQGLLAPTRQENYLGRAEVRQTFEVSKLGMVAGSMVVDGLINRIANIRLLRDSVVLCEAKIASLKRFKDDAREVKQGFECGIGIEGYKDIKAGDIIEAYEVIEIKRTL